MIYRKTFLYSFITILVLAIPLTILLLSGIFFIAEKEKTDIELTVNQTATLLGTFITQKIEHLQILSADSGLHNTGITSELRLQDAEPLFQVTKASRIYIISADGTGLSQDGKKQLFDSAPFFASVRKGNPSIINPLNIEGIADKQYAIAIPVMHNGAFAGALLEFIPWKNFSALIENLQFEKNGFSFIKDASGEFLAFPGADPEKLNLDSKKSIYALAPIPGTSWFLGTTVLRSEVLSQVWLLQLLYAFMLIALMLGVVSFYRRTLSYQSEKEKSMNLIRDVNIKLTEQSRIISKMAKIRLSESKIQYESLFENMSSGATLHEILYDEKGVPVDFRFLSINGMAEKMMHLKREDIIGKSYREFSPKLNSKWINALSEVANGGAPLRLDNYNTEDGTILQNIAYSPKPGQFVMLFDDITEETNAKLALEEERIKLIEATRTAEKANQSKSRFLANMSHEIRTPLNAIIGLAEIEIESQKDPFRSRPFSEIREAGKNLMSLLNDILDYSKMEAGKLSLVKSDFLLEDVIANALMVTIPRLNKKTVQLLVDIDLHLPARIFGDPLRLWQILKNVLDNACKFTDEGEILLRISNIENKSLQFSFFDTGIGIAAEHMDNLFGVFEQIGENTTHHLGGTGLGLSITGQLVDMMEGSISFESSPGKGTQCTVTLPLEPATDGITLSSLIKKSRVLNDFRILIIASDKTLSHLIESLLEHANCIPACASNVPDALSTIRRLQKTNKPFDLIILDSDIPGTNGVHASEEIIKISPSTPIILMVNTWNRNQIEDGIKKTGLLNVIDKPFLPTRFFEKLSSFISDKGHLSVFEAKKSHDQYPMAKILVTEDNPQNREVLGRMLQLFGIQPDIACDGTEALLMAGKQDYDLILMDIQMPKLNGLDATRLIRAQENATGKIPVPIIAMTAYAMDEDLQNSKNAGMNDHITKPLEIAILSNILDTFLEEEKEQAIITDSDGIMPEIEGINTHEGLERLGGDSVLYARLLVSFKKMIESPQSDAKTALSPDKIQETLMHIHTIKGLAGSLGAKSLNTIAIQCEKSLKESEQKEELYEKFITSCIETAKAIELKIQIKTEETQDTGFFLQGTDEELNLLLSDLLIHLENGDVSEIKNRIDQLSQKKYNRLSSGDIAGINNLSLSFDYDQILKIISRIIQV